MINAMSQCESHCAQGANMKPFKDKFVAPALAVRWSCVADVHLCQFWSHFSMFATAQNSVHVRFVAQCRACSDFARALHFPVCLSNMEGTMHGVFVQKGKYKHNYGPMHAIVDEHKGNLDKCVT